MKLKEVMKKQNNQESVFVKFLKTIKDIKNINF